MNYDNILEKLNMFCSFHHILHDVEPVEGSNNPVPKTKIGHIRADHDGYRWWSTYWPCHEQLLSEASKAEAEAVFEALTGKTALHDLDALQHFCWSHPVASVGDEEDEFNFYLIGDANYYWLRLITREKDYNLYLHFYSIESQQQKYFSYLDWLRHTGVTNMFGAVPYLQEAFPELQSNHTQAKEVLKAWIESRGKREGAT